MPEPFKNWFNKTLIEGMAGHFLKAWPEFDQTGFVRAAADHLENLELKARSEQITQAMQAFLPDDFSHAGEIMLHSLSPENGSDLTKPSETERGISGWAILPMTHYVGLRGLEHFNLSMTLLKEMTKRFSSEFGIRFFLLKKPDETLAVLANWVEDPNEHVRRLISEGTRPRLPWAMQLPALIKDPSPILPLLEALKDDPSEYVRRSVANNLNDIAKDHADRVAGIAKNWLSGASKDRQKLVRHACRTLIKQGHPATLNALGYHPAKVQLVDLNVKTPQVFLGNPLIFEIVLNSETDKDQPLILDYIIHHRKANGRTTPKVFKWKTLTLPSGETYKALKKHSIKPVTTRTYYPGLHRFEIMINGETHGGRDFELVMAPA